jgi:hypothetical protein
LSIVLIILLSSIFKRKHPIILFKLFNLFFTFSIYSVVQSLKGNKKKAEEKLEQFKIEYEQKSKIKLRDPNIYYKYNNILFCDYMIEWLEKQK